MWLAPKVWFHGSQSISTSGCSVMNGQVCSACCWFAVSMPWVLMTPLGRPVEPDVNRNLAIVSAPIAAAAFSSAGPGRVCANWSKLVTASRFAPLRLATSSTLLEVERGERFGEGRGIGDIDEAGLEQLGNVLELGVVLALQRIGDGDRRDRYARGVAGEREEGVVDAVAGEDHHGTLGREPALDQALGERVDELPRRLVGELAPTAAGVALRQEQARRIALDRRAKKARQARIVRGERHARAHARAAVGRGLADDVRARERERPKRRCLHGILRGERRRVHHTLS